MKQLTISINSTLNTSLNPTSRMLYKGIIKRIIVFSCVFLCFFDSYSQTRIKAMFYNVLFYSDEDEDNQRTPHLKNILDEIAPDLFMVCELEDEAGSNYLFNNAVLPHNPDFLKANYQTTRSSISLNQMVYYNKKKLILESQSVIGTNSFRT